MNITPSINVQDFAEAQRQVRALAGAADTFHLDAEQREVTGRDTWADPTDLARLADSARFDVHLMMRITPLTVRRWLKENVTRVFFHAALTESVPAVIKMIKREKKEPWAVVSHDEDDAETLRFAPALAGILVLAVHPGPSAQAMIPGMVTKIGALHARFPGLKLGFDGGVDWKNLAHFHGLPLDRIVLGHLIYGAGSPAENFLRAKDILHAV